MAFKIIWSEQARDDLQAVVLYVAGDNPTAAELLGCRLMHKVDLLEEFPLLGRVVPEENDETIRELISRPYRIIYQVVSETNTIAIVRIWHGARGEPEIPSETTF